MLEDEIECWDLDAAIAEAEQKAVFFRNTVEAPRMVGCAVVGKVEDALHPVAAPRTWIKERNDTKRLRGCFAKATAEGVARDHVRRAGLVGIEQEIDARKQRGLRAVGDAPVQEEGALVLERRPLGVVAESEVRNEIFALSKLEFPARHIGVNKRGRLGQDKRCPGTEHDG